MPEKDPMSAPYHYGCHYSNSGTVLHFLVRLPPFTKMFVQYQGTCYVGHVGIFAVSVLKLSPPQSFLVAVQLASNLTRERGEFDHSLSY